MAIRAAAPLLTGLALLAAASPAGAATYDDALAADWGGPTFDLNWDGSRGVATADTIVGAPVTVPGDVTGRTLTIRNDGPCAGTLTAAIVNVDLLDPGAPDVHHNPDHQDPDGSGAAVGDPYLGAGDQGDFYDDLTLAWRTATGTGSASFTALDDAATTPILEMALSRGGTTTITVVADFPYDATSGNTSNVAPRMASFEVQMVLRGEECAALLPETGANVGGLALASAVAIAAGAALRALSGRNAGRHRRAAEIVAPDSPH